MLGYGGDDNTPKDLERLVKTLLIHPRLERQDVCELLMASMGSYAHQMPFVKQYEMILELREDSQVSFHKDFVGSTVTPREIGRYDIFIIKAVELVLKKDIKSFNLLVSSMSPLDTRPPTGKEVQGLGS